MDGAEAINIMKDLHNRWATWRGVSGADTPEVMQAINMAIAALREQSNANQRNSNASNALEWISVKEKPMPEGNEEYEVCCDYRGEKRIEIHKGWNTHGVTHWRPLPEPPKEGADHA